MRLSIDSTASRFRRSAPLSVKRAALGSGLGVDASTITASRVDVDGVGGQGIRVGTSRADLEDLNTRNTRRERNCAGCEGDGIELIDSRGTLRRMSAAVNKVHGLLLARSCFDVTDVTIAHTEDTGIYALGSTTTASRVAIDDARASGVHLEGGEYTFSRLRARKTKASDSNSGRPRFAGNGLTMSQRASLELGDFELVDNDHLGLYNELGGTFELEEGLFARNTVGAIHPDNVSVRTHSTCVFYSGNPVIAEP